MLQGLGIELIAAGANRRRLNSELDRRKNGSAVVDGRPLPKINVARSNSKSEEDRRQDRLCGAVLQMGENHRKVDRQSG